MYRIDRNEKRDMKLDHKNGRTTSNLTRAVSRVIPAVHEEQCAQIYL